MENIMRKHCCNHKHILIWKKIYGMMFLMEIYGMTFLMEILMVVVVVMMIMMTAPKKHWMLLL